jgi:hypothetical protein
MKGALSALLDAEASLLRGASNVNLPPFRLYTSFSQCSLPISVPHESWMGERCY